MARSLPLRANLEWLKKQAKDRLAELRVANPAAKLSEAQLVIARDFGFPSWRQLKARVEEIRAALDALAPKGAAASTEDIAPDDPELRQLFAAVYAGDVQAVARLLTVRRSLATARDARGQTPLHAAAFCNDPRLGVYLVACGADPQAHYGDGGHTALSWAATCNSVEFASAMFKLGQVPDLYCAAGLGSLADVQACFDDAGKLISGASQTGSSRFASNGTRLPCPPETAVEQISDALCLAARNARQEVSQFLLSKAPDLRFKAFMGATALHWAYFGGSQQIIQQLRQAGAQENALDDVIGCSPAAFGIFAPASWGLIEVVKKRLAESPQLATLVDNGTTALHQASAGDSPEIVRMLLQAGADATLRDREGRTPLEIATTAGDEQVIAELRTL